MRRARDPVRPLDRGRAARRPDRRARPRRARRVRRAGADRPGRSRVRGVRAPATRARCSAAPARAARWRWPPPAGRAPRTVGVVPHRRRSGTRWRAAGLADDVALADARDPVALAAAVTGALGGPADVTVVCVDVPGCEHGAILATADGGTVIFFSMATSFPGRRARRRGPGRRRHDADRQRLRARPRRRSRWTCCAPSRRCGAVRGPAGGRLTRHDGHPSSRCYRGGRVYSAGRPARHRPARRATAGSPGSGADADAPAADRDGRPARRAGHAGVRGRARARHRHRPDPAPAWTCPAPRSPARCSTRWPAFAADLPGRRGGARPRLGRVDLAGPGARRRRGELDRAGGGRRVYLSQASIHSALCSSAAAGRRCRPGVRRATTPSGWLRRAGPPRGAGGGARAR